MPDLAQNLTALHKRLDHCAHQAQQAVALLAVSKSQSSACIALCAQLGQRAFGENYVQEALPKIRALTALTLQWHFIGPLQSNKCQAVAEHFDWVHSIDREKLIPLLDKHRPAHLAALNVLIQVNIDDQASKSGCAPEQIAPLAACIAQATHLRLRGLMLIPNPQTVASGQAFTAMQKHYQELQLYYPDVDTLSMGMSDDFPQAIAHGANMVRVGSALFGPRTKHSEVL